MVYPGSQDFCVGCFRLFSAAQFPTHCPHCGVSNVCPILPVVPIGGNVFPEIDVLSRYVPRLHSILVESGRFMVEGIFGPKFRDFLWMFFVDEFRGLDGTNRGFLLWDGELSLAEGTPIALFEGLVNCRTLGWFPCFQFSISRLKFCPGPSAQGRWRC